MRPSRNLLRLFGIVLLLAVLGWLDYATGYELQFFLFYFVPVALAAWFVGRAQAIVVAVASAAIWFGVEFASGHPYSRSIYLYWNTAIRLASFLIIALVLAQIRFLLDTETHLRKEVQKAMGEIKQLRGFLPICASCKRIRNDAGLWEQIELYIREHSDAEFTHGLCPDCAQKYYGDLAARRHG
jgi:hypothetical protein